MNPREHMMSLQGKDYLPVAARVVWMRQEHPEWSISTSFQVLGDVAHMRAEIRDGAGALLASAHKRIRGQGEGRGPAAQFPVETSETGAVGRALAFCGYGTLAGDLDEGEDIADAPVEHASVSVPALVPEVNLEDLTVAQLEARTAALRNAWADQPADRPRIEIEAAAVKAALEQAYADAADDATMTEVPA